MNENFFYLFDGAVNPQTGMRVICVIRVICGRFEHVNSRYQWSIG
jgi:hypothetical protein